MGRNKADGSETAQLPEAILVRPAGEAEDTGIAGAGHLFCDCAEEGSQPRPIHEKHDMHGDECSIALLFLNSVVECPIRHWKTDS